MNGQLRVLLVDRSADPVSAKKNIIASLLDYPDQIKLICTSHMTGALQYLTTATGARKVDAILLDPDLPDCEVDEAPGLLLPYSNGTALIIITHDHNEEKGLQFLREGAQDYLCKTGLDEITLLRSLRHSIERHNCEEKLKKVTTQLQLAKEAAEKANSAKSAFLANMSHEIRTPLGAILGFAELIMNSEVQPQDRQKIIDSMKRNGRMLANLIDDILDLSKVESGKMEVDRVDVSLDEVITDVVSLLHHDALRKGLKMQVLPKSELPEFIRTDPLRFRQILINIIGNAIKFTSSGHIDLELKMANDSVGKRLLYISVRDTGRGIGADENKKLFSPFVQADNSTTRQYGGTGLGLALSKKLAKSLGGDLILAESTLGMGSLFTLTIDPGPVGIGPFTHLGPLAEVKDFTNSTPDSFTDLKVLLVDDSQDNQTLIRHLLRRVGISIQTANNGQEGLDKIEKGNFDLVLMDLQMPEMDGYAATKTLRNRGVKLPVIALTAHAMLEERRKCLSSGFDEHLCKPIDYDSLLKILARFSKRNGEIATILH